MGRRILYIEDERVTRELTAALLENAGYDVAVACDGQEGVELAALSTPNIVICDLMTPRMHGYEVIQRLRSSEATRTVPIIVLSAKTYESDQRRALDLGATEFLLKPCAPELLLERVARHLDGVRVTFWGVRGSIAAPGPETMRYGGNTPCTTVEYEGHTLILDAGTGIRKLGVSLQQAAGSGGVDVDLLISHTHWDHIQGFPFFVPAFVPGNTLRIWGPPSPDKPLGKVLKGQMDPAYFPVALGDMSADITVHELRDSPTKIGPFEVGFCYLNHPGMTLGYRISAGGVTVTYATDTEPFRTLLEKNLDDGTKGREYGKIADEDLVRLARGADLYIADSQYTPADYEQKIGWGHTCYEDAVELAVQAQVGTLALFSHDPMHDDDAVDEKVATCRAMLDRRASAIEVIGATEGASVTLAPDTPALVRGLRPAEA